MGLELRWTRRQYMEREVAHWDYYGQFVTAGVLRQLSALRRRIQASQDPYFNDIPLHEWDQLAPLVPSDVKRAVCEANSSTYQSGAKVYSLSDMVCVLKAGARQIREEHARRTSEADGGPDRQGPAGAGLAERGPAPDDLPG